jgi:hypothetical protein
MEETSEEQPAAPNQVDNMHPSLFAIFFKVWNDIAVSAAEAPRGVSPLRRASQ